METGEGRVRRKHVLDRMITVCSNSWRLAVWGRLSRRSKVITLSYDDNLEAL